MPWVRIDEHAMEHPKILALSDGAFRLWVRGLAHCQKHLTDGFISTAALKTIRGAVSARVKELVTPIDTTSSPLWDAVEDGHQVHHYLDWNESREHVLLARQHAKTRMDKLRGSRERTPNERRTNPEQPPNERGTNGVPHHSTPHTSQNPKTKARVNGTAPEEPTDDLAERAGRFLERYRAMYERYRKGAKYVSRPSLDYVEAVELVKVWDDERLDKVATVFLTTDHHFAEGGSRTIAQFRALASWCDGKICEAGL